MSVTQLDRYEIGRGSEEYSTRAGKNEAFLAASRLGQGTEVFDRMAKHGAWELWIVNDLDQCCPLRRKGEL